MLKVCPVDMTASPSHFLQVDSRKKQVTLYDPSTLGYTAQAHRKPGSGAPKMFAFDNVFGQDDSLVGHILSISHFCTDKCYNSVHNAIHQ